MRRRGVLTGMLGVGAAWCLPAAAQQQQRPRRIGVLTPFEEADPVRARREDALRQGLRDLGWIEGRNIVIDQRASGGDPQRMRDYARELVALKPDVLHASASLALRTLTELTRTIPIVSVMVIDPLASGYVKSLARPGGNVTGFSNVFTGLETKWVEMIAEAVPGLRRLGFMGDPSTTVSYEPALRSIEAAARSRSIEVMALSVRARADVGPRFEALAATRPSALVVHADAFSAINRQEIIAQAARHRVPAIYAFDYMVREGALMSYGIDGEDISRRSATYVDKILKGESPADLPFQQPTRFKLAINMRTAKMLGIEMPVTLLAIADEVIE